MALEILQQPARQEAHPLATSDMTQITAPGKVLQRAARIRSAQEDYRFFEVEKLYRWPFLQVHVAIRQHGLGGGLFRVG